MQDPSGAGLSEVMDSDVTYYLRDLSSELCEAWKSAFADYKDNFKISTGDIFSNSPVTDAIVSPANSFGFMYGGINRAYTQHFGRQMSDRLQRLIVTTYNGELLVGQALIMPSYGEEQGTKQKGKPTFSQYNKFKWMIVAPTMRVNLDVADTVNAYLAFRAVILAVREHNTTPGKEPIRSVLIPGLGTAVGKMSKGQCAWQMLQAYETVVIGNHPNRSQPKSLDMMRRDHQRLIEGRCGPRQSRLPEKSRLPENTPQKRFRAT